MTAGAAFGAVLFDFGDTLFHRRGGHLAVVEAARSLGVDLSEPEASASGTRCRPRPARPKRWPKAGT